MTKQEIPIYDRDTIMIFTIPGTHDFTPFWELMIPPIHYTYITDFVQTGLCLRVEDSGLFAMISLCCLRIISYIFVH